jgi:dTMP kinase
MVFYLDVTLETSLSWLSKKKNLETKKYLKGKKDLAENNYNYLKNSRKTALSLEKKNKNWKKISCYRNGKILTPEEVHQELFEVLKNNLKI